MKKIILGTNPFKKLKRVLESEKVEDNPQTLYDAIKKIFEKKGGEEAVSSSLSSGEKS